MTAWPPRVVEALTDAYGPAATVHTAIPPLSLGGELADVAEHPQPDGTVVYATAGVSEGGGWSANELVLHAKAAEPRLAEMMARLGGSARHRRYVAGGTLPLGGPEAPFEALGFLWSGRSIHVDETRVTLLQVLGLTHDELQAARRASLYTVEAAFWKDGVNHLAEPGRPTSPSLAALLPVRPPAGLGPDAQDLLEAIIQVDHDSVEGLRMRFSEAEARTLASALGEQLPHPAQLACLLHGLMDFTIPELRRPALRLLQLSPKDAMAAQYYADALAMLGALAGEDHTAVYFRYSDDFEAAQAEAARLRRDEDLPIVFGS